MHAARSACIGLLSAAIGLTAAAGCGSPEITTAPISPVSSTGSASAATAATPRAGVGDTLELAGSQAGERMAVTVTQVVDPAFPSTGFDSPSPGDRLVAVQFRLSNTGTAPYSDSPSNGAQVIDSTGQGFNAVIAGTSTAGPAFPAGVRVAPGESALGFITFDIPARSAVAKVQFTLESGFAAQTGQWTVTGAPGSPRTPGAPTTPGSARTPGTPATPTATPTVSTAAPAQVVLDYVAAINSHDYARAWALGGRNLGGSYQSFVAGFADTAHDTVTITSVRGNTVGVVLDALQNDGSHRFYSGTYTVVNGVITGAAIR
ncbi:DUF4352 domain-containing protein [Kitasatospora sp. NBC_00374]|uniref:DUF4352 domain-containing protein n=1 Tax=Kitasatospora sp. NBC_00374 TaxID=2975964 RepID=UPI0032526516